MVKCSILSSKFAIGNTEKILLWDVIVKNNEIVGTGYTSKNGRPHAEENALTMAGKKLRFKLIHYFRAMLFR